jgi:hypothetical protein
MYVQRNIVGRSRNHCCRGKASGTSYAVSVSVTFIHRTCHAHAPYYIVICGLASSIIFFHIFS